MNAFLQNWATSRCWEVAASVPAAIVMAPTPPAAVAERAPQDQAPVDTAPRTDGDLLASLGIRVRYITTQLEAEEVVAQLAGHEGHLGLDLETAKRPEYANHPQAGRDPHLSRIRLAQIYCGGEEAFVFDLFAIDTAILRPLLRKPFVAHNATFELKHLMHADLEPDTVDCTMLQANALGGGCPKLSVLADELLGWRISKELQTSDWGAPSLTPEQLEYAALDAVLVHKLFPLQARQIRKKRRERCYELMRDAQHAVARMELNGVYFDRAAQEAVMESWRHERKKASEELGELFGAGVNFASPTKLAAWMVRNVDAAVLGKWPRTDRGALKTGAKVLALYTGLPFVKPLLRWKELDKLLTAFGHSYSGHISPATGRIHASFQIAGAGTGRMTCHQPNVQNPPKGGGFRALFAAPPGRTLVVADYSQIELRVMAIVANEKTMLAAYSRGIDLHRKTAAALTGAALDAVTKQQRQMAKAVNFGLLFGQGAPGLAKYARTQYGVDMSEVEARKYRGAFFATYPGLRRWQRRTAELAERSHSVRTPAGRVRSWKRERGRSRFTAFLNTPIQGGAAEVLQAALTALDRKLEGLDAKLVNVVHDEIVLEVGPQDVGAAKVALEQAMVEGMLAVFAAAVVEGLVDAHAGENWAAAKP